MADGEWPETSAEVVAFDPVSALGDDEITEFSLAETFAAMRRTLRYCARFNRWYIYRRNRWEVDSTVEVFDLIRKHHDHVALVKSKAPAWIFKAQTVAAVERLARADRRYATRAEDWDADPWLLNTPAGPVDLRTGRLMAPDPSLLLSRCTSVAPGGRSPRWERFLKEVTDGDDELVEYLRRLSGLSLVGAVIEHLLALLYGSGRNGKGVFLGALQSVLGDYAGSAPAEMFLEARGERHPTELATLHGRRVVVAQETDEGRRLNESRVKALTGGDRITARFMRGDFFEFVPSHTLLIATNNKPRLRHVDEAIRARLHLVPFTVTIPAEKRDPNLSMKLREEWGGILQWMIDGCLEYQSNGLQPPERVRDASAEYFEQEDELSDWIASHCVRDASAWASADDLFNSWVRYCKAAGLAPGHKIALGQRLESAGFQRVKGTGGQRRWAGIGLLTPVSGDQQEADL